MQVREQQLPAADTHEHTHNRSLTLPAKPSEHGHGLVSCERVIRTRDLVNAETLRYLSFYMKARMNTNERMCARRLHPASLRLSVVVTVVTMFGLSFAHGFQLSLLTCSRMLGAGAAAERTCTCMQKTQGMSVSALIISRVGVTPSHLLRP